MYTNNRVWPNLARRYFWVVEIVGSNPITLTSLVRTIKSHIWAVSVNGSTPVLHTGSRGSNPLQSTEMHSLCVSPPMIPFT